MIKRRDTRAWKLLLPAHFTVVRRSVFAGVLAGEVALNGGALMFGS